jgi:hypothetical protein
MILTELMMKIKNHIVLEKTTRVWEVRKLRLKKKIVTPLRLTGHQEEAVAADAGALADLEGLKSVVEPVDALEDPDVTINY